MAELSISSQNTPPVIGDLRWALTSPFLCGMPPPEFSNWVAGTDWQHLDPVEFDGLRRGAPIGRYFEQLLSLWLQSRPGVADMVTNLPVQGHSRTLGEMDLLFRFGEMTFHWEMAVKFYLGVGDRRLAESWYGPEARDRLDLKLDKIASRQLVLPETDAGKAALAAIGFDWVDSHEFIKGILFHPFADWRRSHRPCPPGINPQHDHGWWLARGKLDRLGRDSKRRWMALGKADWFCPAPRIENLMRDDDLPDHLDRHFSTDHRPVMLGEFHCGDGSPGPLASRGFVVPDSWPLLEE